MGLPCAFGAVFCCAFINHKLMVYEYNRYRRATQMKDIRPPVITSDLPGQLRAFEAFMAGLRHDNTMVAGLEIKRLKPYVATWSKQLKKDLKSLDKKGDAAGKLADPAHLNQLFCRVAQRTRNTILSEVMVAPEPFLNERGRANGNTVFANRSWYEGYSFSFGFIQVREKKEKTSVSFPVLGLDPGVMDVAAQHKPGVMLGALQSVMTVGNHDMLHHYTNDFLNPAISDVRRDESLPTGQRTLSDWHQSYFSRVADRDPDSYESWLMLNHARSRRALAEGPEGKALKEQVDLFFDELGRLGRDMIKSGHSEAVSHSAVDYFGTMMGFSLMRFLPLDHPLLDHALERMKASDPNSELLMKRAHDISRMVGKNWSYNGGTTGDANVEKARMNYRAKGLDLRMKKPDYAALKKMQLVLVAPWVAHLLSPPQPGTRLEEIHERVGKINVDMVEVLTASYGAAPGLLKKGKQSSAREKTAPKKPHDPAPPR